MSVAVADEVLPPGTELQRLGTEGDQVSEKPLRDAKGRLLPGYTANRNGGRPKKLRDIEKLLNTEHRNIPVMRETFNRLRALALGEVIAVPYFDPAGLQVKMNIELKADARFMQLYLDRVLGPAKAFETPLDFSDAPAEVLDYLVKKVDR